MTEIVRWQRKCATNHFSLLALPHADVSFFMGFNRQLRTKIKLSGVWTRCCCIKLMNLSWFRPTFFGTSQSCRWILKHDYWEGARVNHLGQSAAAGTYLGNRWPRLFFVYRPTQEYDSNTLAQEYERILIRTEPMFLIIILPITISKSRLYVGKFTW